MLFLGGRSNKNLETIQNGNNQAALTVWLTATARCLSLGRLFAVYITKLPQHQLPSRQGSPYMGWNVNDDQESFSCPRTIFKLRYVYVRGWKWEQYKQIWGVSGKLFAMHHSVFWLKCPILSFLFAVTIGQDYYCFLMYITLYIFEDSVITCGWFIL